MTPNITHTPTASNFYQKSRLTTRDSFMKRLEDANRNDVLHSRTSEGLIIPEHCIDLAEELLDIATSVRINFLNSQRNASIFGKCFIAREKLILELNELEISFLKQDGYIISYPFPLKPNTPDRIPHYNLWIEGLYLDVTADQFLFHEYPPYYISERQLSHFEKTS